MPQECVLPLRFVPLHRSPQAFFEIDQRFVSKTLGGA